MPEKSTLALLVPSQQSAVATLSREKFVKLLDFAEEELRCERVLVCFEKRAVDTRQGLPRALKCIGFTVLPPDCFPPALDKDAVFAMVYHI